MQKTAYEMRISDWSSDVCSSDLGHARLLPSDQIAVQLLWVKAYQSDSRGGARRRRATTCCHSRSSRGPKLTVGASSVASIRLGRRRQTEHRICSIIFSGRLFQRCSANQRQRKEIGRAHV